MKDYLRRDKINKLINCNTDIAEGYKDFRKNYPYNKVIDMWDNAHLCLPIIEVTIKFICGSCIYYYEYYHNLNKGKPSHILKKC